MLITLLFIFLLVLGILLIVLGNKTSDYDASATLFLAGALSFGIGLIGLIISLTCIISTHVYTNVDLDRNNLRYENLVKQVEMLNSDYENISNVDVTERVYQWNKDVYDAKFYADNPWTSWYWNKTIVDQLQYIDLGVK